MSFDPDLERCVFLKLIAHSKEEVQNWKVRYMVEIAVKTWHQNIITKR